MLSEDSLVMYPKTLLISTKQLKVSAYMES